MKMKLKINFIQKKEYLLLLKVMYHQQIIHLKQMIIKKNIFYI